MCKNSCDKKNKHLYEKSDEKEPSEKYYFNNRYWDNYFCDDCYSPPFLKEDICQDKHHEEKKSKEHKDCEEKLIKCNVVITRKHVQKVGTLEIPAPIGVGLDIATGKLTVPVELEPCGEPVFTPQIINDTLINEGYVPVRLKIKDKCMGSCIMVEKGLSEKFFIPFQSEIKIKDIKPDDKVDEKIKAEFLSVFGFPEFIQQKCGGVITKLILKVILDVKIIVSRECVIPVLTKICRHDC